MKFREGDCSSCVERFFCKKLCPAAELYVNQDFVKMREMPRGLLKPRRFPQIDPLINLTEREYEIVTLLAYGFTRKQISQKLGITNNTLRQHVGRIKNKYLKK